ncbi:MAG: phosphoglucomutase/phosphomannomutase family protein [Candidatus Sabulitectum sp.]|nr:phosphoglucomutase/phosphomannomutase family protein [Candidatus Sabulitectum sp.]
MIIKFGTSGWRGVISREFTWDRAMAVVDAIAMRLTETGFNSIAIGGDCRFLSPELADAAAERMARYGFKAYVSERSVPTPVLSHACRKMGLGGVVNFTASHNPPLYNGIKFSPYHGGPADGDDTARIEELIVSGSAPESTTGGCVLKTDFISPYLRDIDEFINVETFRNADSLRVVYDAFSGAGSGVLDRKLIELGGSVRVLNGKRDPLFAGREHPEPNEQCLSDLSESVRRSGASLGIATDGDADRFGIVDENGNYVTPHDFMALLVDYLAESGQAGRVVRSITTGSLLDRVSEARGLEVKVTPVGFKYLGAEILKGGVLLAGEESGGLSLGTHVPEKDGVLAGLLAAEMVCHYREGLGSLLGKLWEAHGRFYNTRLDLPLEPAMKKYIVENLFNSDMKEAAGLPVRQVNRTDGVQLVLDENTWVLVRLSGTEPLARIYVQSQNAEENERISLALAEEFGKS